MAIAKALQSMHAGIHQLRLRRFNRADAVFNNSMEANKVLRTTLNKKGSLIAFVPRHFIEKGYIKGGQLRIPH